MKIKKEYKIRLNGLVCDIYQDIKEAKKELQKLRSRSDYPYELEVAVEMIPELKQTKLSKWV